MKGRSQFACLSAAVLAALYGGSLQAADLTWDSDPSTSGVQDGSGNWNTTSPNWFNGASNVLWSNATPDSAFLGGAGVFNGNTPAHSVTVTSPITVQNITFGIAADGAIYNVFDDFGGGALTLAGNVDKAADNGTPQFLLGNGLTLAAGQHVFALRDTPGDAAELTMNAAIGGSGGITLDNGSYDQWGTLVFTSASNYTGPTNINKGRLVVTSNGALGANTSTVNIGAAGALAFYGAQTTFAGDITVSNPVNITRSVYDGAGFDNYRAAIISSNTGNPGSVMTFNGPFTIDSTDARVQANSSKIVISSNIQQGGTVPQSTLTVDGDFAGTISLTGNNTALLGGIRLIGGVELDVTNQNNLGGPSSPLIFSGNATLHPIGGFMTDFGTHAVNFGSFSGGIDVDPGQQFTINQNLTGGSLNKRGLGTLNIGGSNNLTGGQSFYDAGVVNYTGTGTTNLHSIHLRSPILNIGTGTVTTANNFSSFGQDSNGTNGGPDQATVNVFGNGALVLGDADANISDNQNTAGTLNISGNGYVSSAGLIHVAKSIGGTGTINQSGGQFIITRTGNFSLVLGSRRGTGTFNMSGGTFTSAGEVYAGQGAGADHGIGFLNQTGGVINMNNWFVVGRESGAGTVDLSGGTFNKAGGGNIAVGDSDSGMVNMMTVRGTAVLNSTAGEFWVGNNGGAHGIMNIQDSASVSVNNWFAVGRNGGTGTVIMTGGSLTKSGATDRRLLMGGGGTGTILISGGTITSNSTWIGENAQGTLAISGNGVVNLSGFTGVRVQAGAQGNLLMSGGTLNNSGTINNAGNIAVTGGVANLGVVANANVTGQGSLNIGGTARATAVSVVQPNVTLTGSSTLTILQNGTNAGTSRLGTLAITNPARLDLNDNDLIVTNSSYAAISGLIAAARNGGAWDQPGITSSAAKAAAQQNTTLGVLKGSEYISVAGTSFDGFTVAAFDTLVKYTWYGDTDFNGVVDFDDYVRIDNGFNTGATGWLNGDFDFSGVIDFDDYVLIDLGFNTQNGTLRRAQAYLSGDDRSRAGMDDPALQAIEQHFTQFGNDYAGRFLSAVPEPSAVGLTMVALAGLVNRRWWRQRGRRLATVAN